ncbi:MAG TPA: Flp family type IVb pilin [Marmoricola sp.]|nr:Flp family type IVb pilin [Marmoricola sp.]
MNYFRNLMTRRTEDGASAVEYGLLVAGIAAIVVAIVFGLGSVIHGTFKKTCNTVATGTTTGTNASCAG